jgi:chemotaxis protein methyltransferase CheR
MLTNEEFSLFRNIINQESGIQLNESRKDFLEHRLLKRMRDIGIKSPYWYYKQLTEKNEELLTLLDLLTINETCFFRNKPQFDLLKNIILPKIINEKRNEPRQTLKIWSAGCSTGEESYSIAMYINETIPDTNNWDISLYASDLSFTSLERASKGEYDKDKIHATVDNYYIKKYFMNTDDRQRPQGFRCYILQKCDDLLR